MRPLLIIFCLAVLIQLSGCVEPVKFAEPQPVGKNNIAKFPSNLKGKYRNTGGDDGMLEISNTAIVYHRHIELTIPRQEADTSTNLKLNGNTLTDIVNHISFNVSLSGDTFYGTYVNHDTLFAINGNNVLRKLKGHYLMNTRNDDGSYEVKVLTPEGQGRITITSILKSEIENLKQVTADQEPADSSMLEEYRFKPTKKEFRKFISDRDSFSNFTSFQKIR